MSRMMLSGGRRSCTRSIQAPDRFVSAARFASLASHSVSKRPIWLVEAAELVDALPADDGPHRRIAGEAFGVVDVFVAGEAAVDGLAQQAKQPVANVPSAPTLGKSRRGYRGQAEGVVQLAVGEQPTVRGDPSAMEFQLDPAVEGDPEAATLCLHPSRLPSWARSAAAIALKYLAESAPLVTEMPPYLGNAG